MARATIYYQFESKAMLQAITSFETFDAVAAPGQELTEVVPGIRRLVEAALGYSPGQLPSGKPPRCDTIG